MSDLASIVIERAERRGLTADLSKIHCRRGSFLNIFFWKLGWPVVDDSGNSDYRSLSGVLGFKCSFNSAVVIQLTEINGICGVRGTSYEGGMLPMRIGCQHQPNTTRNLGWFP